MIICPYCKKNTNFDEIGEIINIQSETLYLETICHCCKETIILGLEIDTVQTTESFYSESEE